MRTQKDFTVLQNNFVRKVLVFNLRKYEIMGGKLITDCIETFSNHFGYKNETDHI